MTSNLVCKIDNTLHKNYKCLSYYLKTTYKISSQEYHNKYIGIGKCKSCGSITAFKNLQIGYRDFCSVLCLNRFKSNDPFFIKKLSDSQKGIPRQKHSDITKEKCRLIMLKEWKINRKKRYSYTQNPETRKKISKSVSENGFKKRIT